VSDIYIENIWKVRESIEYDGHHFVSGVLEGVIRQGDFISCPKLPPVRLVKGFIPEREQLQFYAKCFPFVVARTCRPIAREIIYIKMPSKDIRKYATNSIDRLSDSYGVNFSKRFVLIEDAVQFEQVMTRFMTLTCREINFQFRRLVVDPRTIYNSPLNRDWWLASKDLPCIYAPKKLRYGAADVSEKFSSVFGALVLNEASVDDEFFSNADNFEAEGMPQEFEVYKAEEEKFSQVSTNDTSYLDEVAVIDFNQDYGVDD
jgi:hypothetical protein